MKFKNVKTGQIIETRNDMQARAFSNDGGWQVVGGETIVEMPMLEGMTLDQLAQYAKGHNIDIGKATTPEGIIKKIQEAE